MAIKISNQHPSFKLRHASNIKKGLQNLAKHHKCEVKELVYVLCTDEFLLELNKTFLKHNTYTDIVTFDYSQALASKRKLISGEIYMSIDRITENATKFGTPFETELLRVFAHGLLHLIGFKDKTKMQKAEMRKQEEGAIKIFRKAF